MARTDAPPAEDAASDRPPEPSEDATAFTVQEWIDTYYPAAGYDQHTMAGAFYDVPRSRSVSLTDAKAHVRAWLRAEQQVDTPQEG